LRAKRRETVKSANLLRTQRSRDKDSVEDEEIDFKLKFDAYLQRANDMAMN
jgi:hypothetical protein